MSYTSYADHEYLTHHVVIGKLPVVMVRCAQCDWIKGAPGQQLDDIWDAHIVDAMASDRALMSTLGTKLLSLRDRVNHG